MCWPRSLRGSCRPQCRATASSRTPSPPARCALGISSKRASYGIASLTEQGVKVELANWRGVFAGAALSEPQAVALRDAVQRATLHATWKDALARNSWQSAWATGREFREAIELDESLARVMVHLLHLKAA